MGYFDWAASWCFRTASDGRRLFCPWGTLSRGYVIPSERDYQRLRQQIKAWSIVSFVTGVLVIPIIAAWVVALFNYDYGASILVVGLLLSLLFSGFYTVWARSVQRRLLPSNETLLQSLTNQARAHSAAGLWLLEIAALALVGLGIVASLTSNHSFMMLASAGLFGVCAAVFALMLFLRRGHAGGESSTLQKG